jgi:hypothetical protein
MMKRRVGGRLAGLVFAIAVVLSGLVLTPARADVVVQIDKSSQRMAVSVDGAMRYNWPVSTGRDGYGTPSGTFHPQSMARHYFSRKYYNAPMPHANAARDLLLLWLRHSRHHRYFAAGWSGVAWLCQAASLACRGLVRARRAQWPAQYADRDFELARCAKRPLNPSITLPIIDEISRIRFQCRRASAIRRRASAILPRSFAVAGVRTAAKGYSRAVDPQDRHLNRQSERRKIPAEPGRSNAFPAKGYHFFRHLSQNGTSRMRWGANAENPDRDK